jgi:hypothetical protein
VVGELFGLLVAHLILTALPGVAAVLLAARLGAKQVPVLLAIGLAATGVLAMLVFWAYYGGRGLGEASSYFILFGSIVVIALSLRGRRIDSRLLRQLSVPLVLWVLGSCFLVFLGFLHGGGDSSLATASTRFTGQLPSDNDIPRFFGEWFFLHGHHGTPPIYPGEWMASDRPPLQLGYLLSQWGIGWDSHGVNYQLLGVILQQLWIIGLWALLVAARVGRITRALAVLTVLVSDIAIVNGFYVWPKMLPAAMLLAAAALLITPLWSDLRHRSWAAALIAALLALAMLSHGSSVFGVIPLALIAACRGLPSWRWVGVAIAAGLILMAPWSAYQKYGDPPGNRLNKWMLAGVPEIDSRGSGDTILNAYDEAGLGGTLHNKAENFVTMAGGGPMFERLKTAGDALESGDLRLFVSEVRTILFLNLIPSLGLLLIAPFLMLAARRRGRLNPREWSLAVSCFVVFVVGAVAWGLLLFGNEPARTVIHQGSYLLPILGLCGAVCGLRASFPRFAIYLIGASAALMLALYTPALEPPPGTGYSLAAALITALSLVGFGFVALAPGRREPARATIVSRAS